jgi:hypothetical protein
VRGYRWTWGKGACQVKKIKAPSSPDSEREQPPLHQGSFSQRQVAAFRLRAGQHVDMEARVEISPIGLLSVGALVAGILLAVVPIVQAAKPR